MTDTDLSASGGILLYCRAGFEKECATEIQQRMSGAGLAGYVKAKENSGYVLFCRYDAPLRAEEFPPPCFGELIFPRQMVLAATPVSALPRTDRITPLLDRVHPLASGYSAIWLETADTNEAKELSALTRKLAVPLQRAARERGLLADAADAPRLHLFFLSATDALIGLSRPGNSSAWPMGIPRLKFPRGAPSRSTLKLEEALLTFLGRDERALSPGMSAVDLGAAPGGWTWQLVRRHLRVTAVDNGPLQPALLESGVVEHLRTDAFRYQPAKPVDWMVCDVVEQPARIAALVARWLAGGWCRHCIFNLKLPMKQRYAEVMRCRELIDGVLVQAGIRYRLRFRQLYHDREEVTGFLSRS